MPSPSPAELIRSQPLLGTFVTVRAAGRPRPTLSRAITSAFREIGQIHASMSFHDPASELSALNRDAYRTAVTVSDDLFAVLSLARTLFEATGGTFDVSVAPELVRWKYLPRHDRTVRRGTLASLELGPGRSVRFTEPLLLDLGGIAKGYAVDLAVAALQHARIPAGVVNAGGDLRVFGPDAELVHVRHPRSPGTLVPIAELRDAAIATSAPYFSRRRVAGHDVTPIVDPKRRAACADARSVSVIAPACALADALTKVVALQGSSASAALARFQASALILEADGTIVTVGTADAA